MRRASWIVGLALLAGCSHEDYMRIDGDVRGAERDTPRAGKADVYQGAAISRVLYDAAGGTLTPLKDAKVSISPRFNDEHESEHLASVPVDSRTARFHFEAAGKTRSKLTGIHVKVEAPGYVP